MTKAEESAKSWMETVMKNVRKEAIKEFAERLKERCNPFPMHGALDVLTTSAEQIDNLVKEMVGE